VGILHVSKFVEGRNCSKIGEGYCKKRKISQLFAPETYSDTLAEAVQVKMCTMKSDELGRWRLPWFMYGNIPALVDGSVCQPI
jgi:hypothetical protein